MPPHGWQSQQKKLLRRYLRDEAIDLNRIGDSHYLDDLQEQEQAWMGLSGKNFKRNIRRGVSAHLKGKGQAQPAPNSRLPPAPGKSAGSTAAGTTAPTPTYRTATVTAQAPQAPAGHATPDEGVETPVTSNRAPPVADSTSAGRSVAAVSNLPTPHSETIEHQFSYQQQEKPPARGGVSDSQAEKPRKRTHTEARTYTEASDLATLPGHSSVVASVAARKMEHALNGETAWVRNDGEEEVVEERVVSRFKNVTLQDLPVPDTRKKSDGRAFGSAGCAFKVQHESNHDRYVGYIAGHLTLPPKCMKDHESVGLCAQVLTVCCGEDNALELSIGHLKNQFDRDTAQSFLLSPGDMIRIPQNNIYKLQNHSETQDCKMTYVIIQPSPEDEDGHHENRSEE